MSAATVMKLRSRLDNSSRSHTSSNRIRSVSSTSFGEKSPISFLAPSEGFAISGSPCFSGHWAHTQVFISVVHLFKMSGFETLQPIARFHFFKCHADGLVSVVQDFHDISGDCFCQASLVLLRLSCPQRDDHVRYFLSLSFAWSGTILTVAARGPAAIAGFK